MLDLKAVLLELLSWEGNWDGSRELGVREVNSFLGYSGPSPTPGCSSISLGIHVTKGHVDGDVEGRVSTPPSWVSIAIPDCTAKNLLG